MWLKNILPVGHPGLKEGFGAKNTFTSRDLCAPLFTGGEQVAEFGFLLPSHLLSPLRCSRAETLGPGHRNLKLSDHLLIRIRRCAWLFIISKAVNWEQTKAMSLGQGPREWWEWEWRHRRTWAISLDQAAPNWRKNLKHVWNTNLSPSGENRKKRLMRVIKNIWLNSGETNGTTAINKMRPLVDRGSLAALLCCWHVLRTGKRTVIHAYSLCAAALNNDGKYALLLIWMTKTHRAKPSFREKIFATEIFPMLPGFKKETAVVCVCGGLGGI